MHTDNSQIPQRLDVYRTQPLTSLITTSGSTWSRTPVKCVEKGQHHCLKDDEIGEKGTELCARCVPDRRDVLLLVRDVVFLWTVTPRSVSKQLDNVADNRTTVSIEAAGRYSVLCSRHRVTLGHQRKYRLDHLHKLLRSFSYCHTTDY
jgi:hypothetical protein